MKNLILSMAIIGVLLTSCEEGLEKVVFEPMSTAECSLYRLTPTNYQLHKLTVSDFIPAEQGEYVFSFTVSSNDVWAEKFIAMAGKDEYMDSVVISVSKPDNVFEEHRYYYVSVIDCKRYSEASNKTKVSFRVVNQKALMEGLTLNPGPEPNAKPISNEGTNTGWVHEHKAPIGADGIDIEVYDFYSDAKNGLFKVTVQHNADANQSIEELIDSQGNNKELIFMLPVKETNSYTEFKLWNAKLVSSLPSTENRGYQELTFRSDNILQMID